MVNLVYKKRVSYKNGDFSPTLTMAYKFLKEGTISPAEYKLFADQMYEKYGCEKVRRLYQSLLDLYVDMHADETEGE